MIKSKALPIVDDSKLDKYIDKSAGPDACWPWTGSTSGGYGNLTVARQVYRAHRLCLHKVDPQKIVGSYACHTCDNPLCCNPTHLYWGTAKQNCKDRDERGRRRGPAGVTHHKAKLDPDKVREIRRLAGTLSQRDLARQFGVAQGVIWNVIHRKFWKEVT